jgi:hypothetical protein
MNDYYREQLEKGQQYQDFVSEKLYDIGLPVMSYSSKKYQYEVGENKNGFEIKFDDKIKNTGNIYIEVSEKSDAKNKEYISSGIYRNDNTWLYIIGDYKKIYIFSKKQLRKIYENSKKETFRKVITPTSKGFLIPAKYAEETLAIKIIEC